MCDTFIYLIFKKQAGEMVYAYMYEVTMLGKVVKCDQNN